MAIGTAKDSKGNDAHPDQAGADEELRPKPTIADMVASGVSRLTAERTVELQQGEDEPGRARRRPTARH